LLLAARDVILGLVALAKTDVGRCSLPSAINYFFLVNPSNLGKWKTEITWNVERIFHPSAAQPDALQHSVI